MRSVTPKILLTALASLSLAGACSKSEKKASSKAQETTTAAAPGGAAGSADSARPALPPMPRRMRSAEPKEGGGDGVERPRLDDRSSEERRAMRAEMRERFAEARAKHDVDGDGELSADERMAMRSEMTQMRLKRIDADGDGKISRAEADAQTGRRRMLRDFDGADANKDGFVTSEEMEASIAERRANRTDENGGRRRWGGRGRDRGQDGQAPQ